MLHPTLATRGMVACPHALASAAGVDALRSGGSAVDAALAAASSLAVLYPHMCGVGGDAFWLIYDAAANEVSCLDGGGRAAAAATLERFAGPGRIPFRGLAPATLTTPARSRASARPTRVTAGCRSRAACRTRFTTQARASRFPRALRAGSSRPRRRWTRLRRPSFFPKANRRPFFATVRLAETLRAIAAQGAPASTRAMWRRSWRSSAVSSPSANSPRKGAYWGEPIRGRYRDVTLYETPAPTQGFTVLEMLNLIEPLELGPFLGPNHVHLLVQAKQIAYHDRDRWLADPRFSRVPMEKLLSKSHADERRRLIDPSRALPWDKVPSYGSLAGDTVYVAAIDAQGNAASLIFSLYGVFGSCVTSAETGVVLQNRAAYFSLDPKHPNRLEPGKVPLHTLIASLALRDGKLWAALGCMGADGQPQIHLQTYVAMIDFGQDIQQALAGPRWLSGRFALGEARDTLHIEARFPRATIDELERRGHPVDRWGDWNELAGHAHGITRDARTGILAGGFDPRSDGAAVGF
jgi:gamma-glutamyltranspeptidase/glutathione hydrolase